MKPKYSLAMLAISAATSGFVTQSLSNRLDRVKQSKLELASLREQNVEYQIETIALDNAIDPLVFKALVTIESKLNKYAVSERGAIGLGQVLPTNTKFCELPHYSELFKVKENLKCSAKLLNNFIDMFGGDLQKGLQGYNAGLNCSKDPKGKNVCEPKKAGEVYALTVLATAEKLHLAGADKERK